MDKRGGGGGGGERWRLRWRREAEAAARQLSNGRLIVLSLLLKDAQAVKARFVYQKIQEGESEKTRRCVDQG